jgi:hypothetical protein
MSTNRTEEDWFLRGGERPKNDSEQMQTPVVTCQNCGGDNLADEEYCTHCGAALTGGTLTGEYRGDDGDDNELRLYEVEVSQKKTVTQTATVRVRAASEDDAMDLVEDRVFNGDLDVTDLDWTDKEDSDEYADFTAEDAVEAEEA